MLLYAFGFLKKYTLGNYLYVFIVLLCMWSFAVFSGLSSSVIRSVTMFSFFTLTKLKNGKRLTLEAVITSMLILLLIDVNYLYNIGFQLSYVAVISIVVFYPLFSKWIKVKNKITKYFIDVLLISLIAQLGVLPFSLYYFHQVPLHFLIANFFAVSLLPFVLYGGVLVLVKIYFIEANSWIEICYDVFISVYLKAIHYFSSFSNLIIKDVYLSEIAVFSYVFLLFCTWYIIVDFNYKRVKQLFYFLIMCQLMLFLDIYNRNNKSELLIYNSYPQNMITIKNNKALTVFIKDSLTVNQASLLKLNQIKNKIKVLNYKNDVVFTFNNCTYLLINTNKPYHLLSQKGLILVIANNPKINMERLIKNLQPKEVIITSSNYTSNLLKWKSTCKKLQVPFYCTGESGAYVKN